MSLAQRDISCWKQSQLSNRTWLLRALSKYVLENLQGWKLHNPFGQPAHCLAVLTVRVSPYLQPEPLLLHLGPDASCILPHVGCEQPLSVLSPPRRHWGCCWPSPEPSLLPATWTQLPHSLPRGQALQFPWNILVALHWTHCSLSRSLLTWKSNIADSFLTSAEQSKLIAWFWSPNHAPANRIQKNFSVPITRSYGCLRPSSLPTTSPGLLQ